MKKINMLVLLLVMTIGTAFGQTAYNPFTQNINFTPEPTPQGFECNTIQSVEFIQGMTTIDDATDWQNNPLTVTICLTGFTFNGPASTAITGTYAQNFDWVYDSFAPNCVVGTQNRTLPGTGNDPFFPNPLSTGSVIVSLKVPETSPIGTILAVNVNLQVPGYMSQFNSTPDDNESTQTQTYCPLKIKGNVYYDTTLSNNLVDGRPTNRPNDTMLYAHLVDPTGNVIAITPIAADGTYEFLNVIPNTTYEVVLSMIQGAIGQLPPAVELPSLWVNVNEDCCDRIGTDGTPDGKTTVVVGNATVLDVNYGIWSPRPLPLVLSYFFVTENNCAALLSWSTLQEQNTDRVYIYRKDKSTSSFAKIATVKLAGNSSTSLVYSYVDRSVTMQDEAYQYKLEFVDLDGKSAESKVVSVKLNCTDGNSSVNVFPNPVTTELNVHFVTDSKDAVLEFDVVDVTGRKLLTQSHDAVSGTNTYMVNMSSFAVGTYYVRYRELNGLSNGTIKFIKQ